MRAVRVLCVCYAPEQVCGSKPMLWLFGFGFLSGSFFGLLGGLAGALGLGFFLNGLSFLGGILSLGLLGGALAGGLFLCTKSEDRSSVCGTN